MGNRIARRDFLNGFALPLAAGTLGLSPLEAMARQGADAGGLPGAYPPALTGLRGSHPGSFEVAHGLALDGARWPRPERRADDEYDLAVVGGGLSGGHAKRNEFQVNGRIALAHGIQKNRN